MRVKIGRPSLKIKYNQGLTKRQQQNLYYINRGRCLVGLVPGAGEIIHQDRLLLQIGRFNNFWGALHMIGLLCRCKGSFKEVESFARQLRVEVSKRQ